MFAHEFVRNAYIAGTPIAIACGIAGWFLVLRAEVFAADALSHVAFVGAIGAAVVGVDERVGLLALTLLCAGGIATLGSARGQNDVTIGISFAWILGIGALLITLLATSGNGADGITTANALFGSIYALSASSSRLAAAFAVGASVVLLLSVRPLLWAAIEPELAVVRGVRVRLVGLVFLAVLAIITAQSTQAVGALLLLGLIAAPAGAAHSVACSPYRGIALSALFALLAMWGGLALSYLVGSIPPSTAIIGLAAAIFAAAAAARGAAARRSAASPGAASPADART